MKLNKLLEKLKEIQVEYGNVEVFTETNDFDNPLPVVDTELWIDNTKKRKSKPRLVFVVGEPTK